MTKQGAPSHQKRLLYSYEAAFMVMIFKEVDAGFPMKFQLVEDTCLRGLICASPPANDKEVAATTEDEWSALPQFAPPTTDELAGVHRKHMLIYHPTSRVHSLPEHPRSME